MTLAWLLSLELLLVAWLFIVIYRWGVRVGHRQATYVPPPPNDSWAKQNSCSFD